MYGITIINLIIKKEVVRICRYILHFEYVDKYKLQLIRVYIIMQLLIINY